MTQALFEFALGLGVGIVVIVVVPFARKYFRHIHGVRDGLD